MQEVVVEHHQVEVVDRQNQGKRKIIRRIVLP